MNVDEAVLLWVDEYNRMATTYDEHVVPRFAPFAAELVDRAQLRRHATVLDVGTGTGLTALLAAKVMGGTGLVVGTDLADEALALATTKAARAELRNLRFEMLDSRNIVYRGGTFDAALCSFGLPSVGHEQVIGEVFRVLKDGGTFHLLTWGPREPGSGWDAFEESLAEHRTPIPSEPLAQLREAFDLVSKSGAVAAVRDPAAVTAELSAAEFSDVRAEPHAEDVAFATTDDLVAFHASFGTTEREMSEMPEGARAAFREDIEARFREFRDDGHIRLSWTVVFYVSTR